MATYCELLCRHCTAAEMEAHLAEWCPLPTQGSVLNAHSPVLSEEEVVGGNQVPLRPLCSGPSLDGPEGQATPSTEIAGARPVQGEDYTVVDPDEANRMRVRRAVMLTEEFARNDLSRMIRNFIPGVRARSGTCRDEDPGEVSLCGVNNEDEPPDEDDLPTEKDIENLIDEFLEEYLDALESDWDKYEATGQLATDESVAFGKRLHDDLVTRFGNPIESFSYDQRLVFSYFFSWYIETDLPGFGPFDVWAPHPDADTGMVTNNPYITRGPWGDIPGNLYGVWDQRAERAKAFLRSNFEDAVEAGVDVLLFDCWMRPGAAIYPWLPNFKRDDRNWMNPEWGGDGHPRWWLQLAVEVLEDMREENPEGVLPKLGMFIETLHLGPLSPNMRTGMDPLMWASCACDKGLDVWSADWNDRASDPPDSEFVWGLRLPQARLYLASMIRDFFSCIPLEHIAFIENRPVCGLWGAMSGARTPDARSQVEAVNSLFAAGFYGLPLWFVPDGTWGASSGYQQCPFVFMDEPRDPYDDTSDPIRVGDVLEFGGSAAIKTGSELTTYCLGPGSDSTRKLWFKENGDPSKSLHPRDFGFIYFSNWLVAILAELNAEGPYRDWTRAFMAYVERKMGLEESTDPRLGAQANGAIGQQHSEPKRIVVIETWNELYEGSGICRSAEYGDAYMQMTKVFSEIWKQGWYSTDYDWIFDELSLAFAGVTNTSPWDVITEEDLAGLEPWNRLAKEISRSREALEKHPAMLTLSITPPLIEPTECRRRARQSNGLRYVPLTLKVTRTPKYAGLAYVWFKFYPRNRDVYGDWRIFPDVYGDGGIKTQCRLVIVAPEMPYIGTVWDEDLAYTVENLGRPPEENPFLHYINIMPFGEEQLIYYFNIDLLRYIEDNGGLWKEIAVQVGGLYRDPSDPTRIINLESTLLEVVMNEDNLSTEPRTDPIPSRGRLSKLTPFP